MILPLVLAIGMAPALTLGAFAQGNPKMYPADTGYICQWPGNIKEALEQRPLTTNDKNWCLPNFKGGVRLRLLVLDAEELPIVYVCMPQSLHPSMLPVVGRRVMFFCGYTAAEWVLDENGKPFGTKVLQDVALRSTMADVRRLPYPKP